ncbi:MAG: hypothetical protein ISQ70_07880, partial [Pirellulales bacterium]|nr:hypothetical protein [Pirellulales bacterium]
MYRCCAAVVWLSVAFSGGVAVADDTSVLLPPAVDTSELATESVATAILATDGVLPGTACCPPSLCCPDWNSYFLFDVLLLQRDNATNGQPLVLANSSGPLAGQTLLASTSPQFSTSPGIRTFFGRRGPDNIGWEIGYIGLYGMFGDAEAGGADLLTVTPPLGSSVTGWSRAD